MRTFLREIVGTLILAIVIVFVLQITVQSYPIVGSCMEPSFHDGQRVLVNKVAYHLRIGNKIVCHFREPQRGDVIIFLATLRLRRPVYQAHHWLTRRIYRDKRRHSLYLREQ